MGKCQVDVVKTIAAAHNFDGVDAEPPVQRRVSGREMLREDGWTDAKGYADVLLTQSHTLDQQHSLAGWAARYLAEQVYGVQAPNTLEAKTRDLAGFVRWYVVAHGSGRIEAWSPTDTRMYLAGLQEQGKAPATINRVLATLRHFARWAHEQPGAVFRKHGLPTRGIQAMELVRTEVAPLTEQQLRALFAVAATRVHTEVRKNARPYRNRAILTTLFLTGLRVSEMVALRCGQYAGEHFVDVVRKGGGRAQKIYLAKECRDALDAYLHNERCLDDPAGHAEPLFLPSNKHAFMTRQQVGKVLEQLARAACQGRSDTIDVHPTRLRHTLASVLRERAAVDMGAVVDSITTAMVAENAEVTACRRAALQEHA